MIETKEQIIEHFKSGSKDKSNLKIGVEHEKFIFDKKTNTRIDYPKIKKMFENLYEFGWKPIFEEKNPIALTKNGKSITLEPGNQIELSGAKLNNIHEACAESHEYLFELNQVIEKLDFKIVSSGYDPISKLEDIPNNPKKRYEVMTKDMPVGGKLSLPPTGISLVITSYLFFGLLGICSSLDIGSYPELTILKSNFSIT